MPYLVNFGKEICFRERLAHDVQHRKGCQEVRANLPYKPIINGIRVNFFIPDPVFETSFAPSTWNAGCWDTCP